MNWKSIEDRLVDDYKQCLKWFSTQMMAAAGGIQIGWAFLPPSQLPAKSSGMDYHIYYSEHPSGRDNW